MDVVSLGDLVIDFTPVGFSGKGNVLYEKNPGGAPANVAVTVARLGGKAAFLGAIGDDNFGRFLKGEMLKHGVDVSALQFVNTGCTKFSFVSLDENNDRSFYFPPIPLAEIHYRIDDDSIDLVTGSKIFMLSTVSQYRKPICTAAEEFLRIAVEKGVKVAYDPNWNIAFSTDRKAEKNIIINTIKRSNIVKLSLDEVKFVYDTDDYAYVAKAIYEEGVELAAISLGSHGCYYHYKGGKGFISAYKIQAKDTTGAGDAFLGGMLYALTRNGRNNIAGISKAEMDTIIMFAQACGAVCASKMGAMPSVESMDEIYDFQKRMRDFKVI